MASAPLTEFALIVTFSAPMIALSEIATVSTFTTPMEMAAPTATLLPAAAASAVALFLRLVDAVMLTSPVGFSATSLSGICALTSISVTSNATTGATLVPPAAPAFAVTSTSPVLAALTVMLPIS